MKKQHGFTLIELLVVIAVIGILASVVLASLNSARVKARDARRASDIDQLFKAMYMYYDSYGCLPITYGTTCGPATNTYLDCNAGCWDYSSQAGFMSFLKDAGFMPSVPVDPTNNMTGDGSPAGAPTYSYRYYCYPTPMWGSTGLHLGYWKEGGGGGYVSKGSDPTAPWANTDFPCK